MHWAPNALSDWAPPNFQALWGAVGRTACGAPPVQFHASAALLDSLRTRSHPGEALGSPGDCRNALYWLQSLALSASPIRPPLDPSESARLSFIDNTHSGKPPGPPNIP